MNLYFFMIVIFLLIGIKVFFKGFNKQYLSKSNTSCVKGIFILIVLYSHLITYVEPLYSKDFIMLNFRNFLGQLMVTMFLFYSGYGVFESIKNKKEYVNLMPKNRILKTLVSFSIVVLVYYLLQLFLGNSYSIKKVLLSLVGWETLGNSNWYIFSILVMYITTYFSFKIFDDNHKKALIFNFFLIVLFILFLNLFKGEYWFNTIFCYFFGMIYSYQKDSVEKKLFNNNNYFILLFLCLVSFLILRKYSGINFIFYELYSVLFVFLIILITLKVSFNSYILKWFGDNLFWIYILQRIPMIYFASTSLSQHLYRYSLVVFMSTLLLTVIFNFIFNKTIYKLFKK